MHTCRSLCTCASLQGSSDLRLPSNDNYTVRNSLFLSLTPNIKPLSTKKNETNVGYFVEFINRAVHFFSYLGLHEDS